MMTLVLPLMIVAVIPEAPTEVPRGAEVFLCSFDASWDQDYDGWPDGWTRRRGATLPRYVTVRIADEPTPEDSSCLRIDLNGAGAAVFGPPVPVEPTFDYAVRVWVKTEQVTHARVSLALVFLDGQRHRLASVPSPGLTPAGSWQDFRLGPVTPPAEAALAVVGLRVDPGDRPDLSGKVWFDSVRLERFPRLRLSVDRRLPLFTWPEKVVLACQLSGVTDPEARLEVRLEDHQGAVVDQLSRLAGGSGHAALAEVSVERSPHAAGAESLRVQLEAPRVGFYRARAILHAGADPPVSPATLGLVVLQPTSATPSRRFGWTLPRASQRLGVGELGQLLSAAAVGWVKLPVWPGPDDGGGSIEQWAGLARGLRLAGIEPVGLLEPVSASLPQTPSLPEPCAASVFASPPDRWYPALEPVLRRLAPQVRRWQLGRDDDTSFTGLENLPQMLAEVKRSLDQAAFDVSLGLALDPADRRPSTAEGPLPWRFVVLPADASVQDEQLAQRLAAVGASVERWVSLVPLARGKHSLQERTIDLVQRMVAAAAHGADAVFVARPFDEEVGLWSLRGEPTELFLPWRTTVLAIGEGQWLGSIQLPQGSRNHVFVRDDTAVMVVAAERPRREVLALGEDVEQTDVWGRTSRPERRDQRWVVPVGPLPSFLTGLDPRLFGWRQAFRLQLEPLSSVPGVPVNGRFHWKNTASHRVAGRLRLVMPEGWKVAPAAFDFQLAAGESLEQGFTVTLPFRVLGGRHPLRVDVQISAPEAMRFSIFRHVEVGAAVRLAATLRWTDRGVLVVEQRLSNDSDQPVDFLCYLLAPHRRPLSTRVVNLRRGEDVQTYRLADAAALAGTTLWLRAEQIGGPQVLNYRLVVEQPP